MKRFIICAILVLAVATQAYGFGHRGGDAPGNDAVYGGGSFANGATNGSNEGAGGNLNDTPNHVSVPEPATLLLLGAGLVGLVGLKRKMK